MLSEILTLLSLLIGSLVLFWHRIYNNGAYKRFQTILNFQKLRNTPEVQDPIKLQFESGQVPSWLNGIMYRIGKHQNVSYLYCRHSD